MDFFFFSGGGGGGGGWGGGVGWVEKICMYVHSGRGAFKGGSLSVTEQENGGCESVHLYCTQRFTFSPKCFIPVATIRNETVTLTITSTWMSTASQL